MSGQSLQRLSGPRLLKRLQEMIQVGAIHDSMTILRRLAASIYWRGAKIKDAMTAMTQSRRLFAPFRLTHIYIYTYIYIYV